jgi:hypothetical protein
VTAAAVLSCGGGRFSMADNIIFDSRHRKWWWIYGPKPIFKSRSRGKVEQHRDSILAARAKELGRPLTKQETKEWAPSKVESDIVRRHGQWVWRFDPVQPPLQFFKRSLAEKYRQHILQQRERLAGRPLSREETKIEPSEVKKWELRAAADKEIREILGDNNDE